MKEPKPKNTYNAPPERWRGWKVDERHYYNKLCSYMYYHKENFTEKPMNNEEWADYCIRTCVLATDVYRRTKLIQRRHL